ncbi:hypothetical protein Bra1253DRAFT_06076 [Bradyrhizobium sp. WSM1253]|nr:hypothetical protein Bra1253DRAFT_06076 [Bradyrhizobium sp. WSM1253]
MKGTVLHFDGANQNGLIRAEDGRRYGFTAWDYKSAQTPRVGDEIDFEIQDGVAAEIYVVKAASAPSLDLMALRRTVAEGTNKAAERIGRNLSAAEPGAPAQPISAAGVLQIMLNDWRNLLAALALAACLLPLVSFGPSSANLFGAVSSSSMANAQLAQVRNAMQALAPASISTNPWNMPPKAAQAVVAPNGALTSWSLRAAWLLYLVPLLAMATLIQLFRGRDSTRPAFLLGLGCVALVPAAMLASQEFAALQNQMAQMPLYGAAVGTLGITNFLDIGFYTLAGTGAAILFGACRCYRSPPAEILYRLASLNAGPLSEPCLF